MQRVNHYIPQQQLAALRTLAARLGIPVAEVLRRAIADYLKREGKHS